MIEIIKEKEKDDVNFKSDPKMYSHIISREDIFVTCIMCLSHRERFFVFFVLHSFVLVHVSHPQKVVELRKRVLRMFNKVKKFVMEKKAFSSFLLFVELFLYGKNSSRLIYRTSI